MENTEFKLGPIQEKWLQSLEQHPERQGRRYLGDMKEDGTYTACCLGEIGIIAGLCKWKEKRLVVKGTHYLHYLTDVYEKVGLRGEDGRTETEGRSLAFLNDTGTTWPQIAAKIRANPSNYLTKSV